MSKLYDTYLSLKNNNSSSNTLYLFKSGIFFILLDEDAIIASKLFNFKITHFTDSIVKCGFPISSLEKYQTLIHSTNYIFKIVDTSKSTLYSVQNYNIDNKIKDFITSISNVNSDSLSVSEAYDFIDKIQKEAYRLL